MFVLAGMIIAAIPAAVDTNVTSNALRIAANIGFTIHAPLLGYDGI
jgi:hypothetical protein